MTDQEIANSMEKKRRKRHYTQEEVGRLEAKCIIDPNALYPPDYPRPKRRRLYP